LALKALRKKKQIRDIRVGDRFGVRAEIQGNATSKQKFADHVSARAIVDGDAVDPITIQIVVSHHTACCVGNVLDDGRMIRRCLACR
jgi:hypothetical protein